MPRRPRFRDWHLLPEVLLLIHAGVCRSERPPALEEETMRRMVLTLIMAAAVVSIAPAQPQQKKRVAVMNFDYATVKSYSAAIFGTEQDIGKGIADLIV